LISINSFAMAVVCSTRASSLSDAGFMCSSVLSSPPSTRRASFSDFQQLLENKSSPRYHAFRACCYAQFTSESLQFLEACALVESRMALYIRLEPGRVPVDLYYEYLHIYEHFLTTASPWELNVPCEIRREVQAIMENLKRESLKDTPSIVVPTTVFDRAKLECQKMLYTNIFNNHKFMETV
jgi:hypothetical protein